MKLSPKNNYMFQIYLCTDIYIHMLNITDKCWVGTPVGLFLCPWPKRSAGASSNQIFPLSIWLFVCLSIILYHLRKSAIFTFLGGDTVTKLELKVHLRVAHTSLISHAPEGGRAGRPGQNVGLWVLPWASVFSHVSHTHLVFFLCEEFYLV